MENKLNDLSPFYGSMVLAFLYQKAIGIRVDKELLKRIYKDDSTELTMENADNQTDLSDFDLYIGATIYLSEDKKAVYITDNKEPKCILMYLDGKKIMVSKDTVKASKIINDKGFIFKEEKFKTLPKYEKYDFNEEESVNEEEIINKKDSKNKNESSNNSNIYKEKEPENKEKEIIILENGLNNEISVEEDNQNMRLPKKANKKEKKVNFNEKIEVIDVESFKKFNIFNNDDNDKEEKNDINSDGMGSSDSYYASNMKKNNKTQEKPDSNNDNNKMNNLNSNNEDNNIVDNFCNIELKNNNNNVIGNENSQKHPSSNITENNNKDANKEELQNVQNELNKIYSKDNNHEIIYNKSKKNELQLEEYESKTNNGCSCNLDCSGCFKRIFGGQLIQTKYKISGI